MKIEWDGTSFGGTFLTTAEAMLRDLLSAAPSPRVEIRVTEENDVGPNALIVKTLVYTEVVNYGGGPSLVLDSGELYDLDESVIAEIEAVA